MKKIARFLTVFVILCLSLFYADYAYADYAVPGCEEAWNSISSASKISNLENLVKTDCAVMYRNGWRLPQGSNTGGTTNTTICAPAWNGLGEAGKLNDAKFIVTHNCPVLYRKGWVK
ncbi:MAG: hypothetical protein RIM23_02560 [Coleofasciculus sp. G3-WIS-01]|uniref:hypothetical protein n=1 Tax=Coleofasciculus sp. G3-WIS-01 TaxID=3069528 RepID=UPI0032FC7986